MTIFSSTNHHSLWRTGLALFQRRYAHRWGVLVLGVSLLAPAVPAQLPALGDGAEMTTSAERQLGERVARELYRDPDYVDDPILTDYVQSIWQPLLAAARLRGELPADLDERFAWEILLGRDRTLNAFALPGGYLGLHLGLIGAVSRPDELASVLAHELSHVTQRHISRIMGQQSRQAPWLLGALVLAALAASKNPEAANAMIVGGQAAAAQSQLSFSRDMEREADRVGLGVMTQAGFEPQGFISMFEKLQQAARLNDNGSYPYLRSHPLTTERIADVRARLPLVAASAPPVAVDLTHAMMAARARVLTNPGADVLRSWRQEPQAPDFAQRPIAQRAAALYAAALACAQQRDGLEARKWAEQLLQLTRMGLPRSVTLSPAERQARLLIADLALGAAVPVETAHAISLLQDGTPAQRADVLLLAELYNQSGQAVQAAALLQPWVVEHPRDASAWQVLSSAWALQHQVLRSIRAEGEVQMAHLDYAGAVDRYKAARDWADRPGNPIDIMELSVIDTRLHQAEQLLREQQQDDR